MEPLIPLILCYDTSLFKVSTECLKAGGLVVINPNNGPAVLKDWVLWTKKNLETSGASGTIYGYIDLVTWSGPNWNIKSVDQINKEINLYKSICKLNHFWLDDCFTYFNSIHRNEFIKLIKALKLPKSQVILNAGARTTEETLNYGTVCDYECSPKDRGDFREVWIEKVRANNWKKSVSFAISKGVKIYAQASEKVDGRYQSPLPWSSEFIKYVAEAKRIQRNIKL